jgi:hypothetical protein
MSAPSKLSLRVGCTSCQRRWGEGDGQCSRCRRCLFCCGVEAIRYTCAWRFARKTPDQQLRSAKAYERWAADVRILGRNRTRLPQNSDFRGHSEARPTGRALQMPRHCPPHARRKSPTSTSSIPLRNARCSTWGGVHLGHGVSDQPKIVHGAAAQDLIRCVWEP